MINIVVSFSGVLQSNNQLLTGNLLKQPMSKEILNSYRFCLKNLENSLSEPHLNKSKESPKRYLFPPLHSQDLIIIPPLRLFEKSLSSLQAFFYLTVILTVFCCSLVVLNSWKIKMQYRVSIAYSSTAANGR